MESYYRYWGKTEETSLSYHLLPYHCLDVTAVAAAWWDGSCTLRRGFSVGNQMPLEQLRAWVLFFVALHDYGKFDVRFQLRARPVWQSLYPDAALYSALPSAIQCKTYYHGEGGLSWFLQDNAVLLGCAAPLPDNPWDFLDTSEYDESGLGDKWKPWNEGVPGHHGQIRSADWVAHTSLPLE